eukprot:CAMPEP_0184339132 /NCGR_PEP_ID=MMETSP1089-20130417/7824_1 /TAXON_ID=38269 ORGANISM="Gloeochaete wittrockiana, Strain SAG46.84" /NCGR_SAMPLE_ID=MMETSP1089 /ASSEMBLY_ACC=CAM_ASM_000445 /LENGTH=48 /DNA_ID= /DNA_START= /DNA_END= /DNA_ORIENTATION=
MLRVYLTAEYSKKVHGNDRSDVYEQVFQVEENGESAGGKYESTLLQQS